MVEPVPSVKDAFGYYFDDAADERNLNPIIGVKIVATVRSNSRLLIILFAMVLSVGCMDQAISQPECMAWGNLTGIRVEGQLIEFESSLCLIGSDLMQVTQTAKEQQRPEYRLEGNRQTIKTSLGDISFVETVEGIGDGDASLEICRPP